jgi:hypothetical protein
LRYKGIICKSLSDDVLCPLVHALNVFSKLSQAIEHDIAEVKDDLRKGQKGKEMHPSFVVILVIQMLNRCLRPRDSEHHKLDIPSKFYY